MIFIIVGKAGGGKDTVARVMKGIIQDKTAIVHYADYVKWLYAHYFGWDGEKTQKARTDLQTIGTDIVRNTYDEDFWVKRLIEQIQIFHGLFEHFIIADARFPNEIYAMEETFGSDQVITIRVSRPDYETNLTPEQMEHESETALDGYVTDFTVVNDTLTNLKEQLTWILEGLNA